MNIHVIDLHVYILIVGELDQIPPSQLWISIITNRSFIKHIKSVYCNEIEIIGCFNSENTECV